MESIVHRDNNGKWIGSTNFSKSLLVSAIEAAVKRVDGVVRLKGGFWFFLRNFFGTLALRRGVAVRKVGYGIVVIEVCVVVSDGYTAADLSYRIQEAVLNVAQNKNITDKRIKRVNVRIRDVVRQNPEQQQLELDV
ncbi:MAG: Asp23/Gls24 family envelope stress response protein [Firmicutes bacterium]|nr:Asp23/Gls24 family envelope stress response protein [Bacillota bacterium]